MKEMLIIGFLLFVIAMIYACFIICCSDEDRTIDDEEQIEFIRQWRENKKNR